MSAIKIRLCSGSGWNRTPTLNRKEEKASSFLILLYTIYVILLMVIRVVLRSVWLPFTHRIPSLFQEKGTQSLSLFEIMVAATR
jgi:hypothetical protein